MYLPEDDGRAHSAGSKDLPRRGPGALWSVASLLLVTSAQHTYSFSTCPARWSTSSHLETMPGENIDEARSDDLIIQARSLHEALASLDVRTRQTDRAETEARMILLLCRAFHKLPRRNRLHVLGNSVLSLSSSRSLAGFSCHTVSEVACIYTKVFLPPLFILISLHPSY